MVPTTFDYGITVQSAHIDELKHVNNVVYLQWVQDAAAAHWHSTASDTLKQSYHWVVLRHEIDYKSPAFLGDEINAKTWVESYEGVRSTRIVQLMSVKDNRLLAEARTTWCLLSAATGRPARIVDEIREVFSPAVGD